MQPINLCDWIGTASLSEFKSADAIKRYFSQASLREMFGPDADLSGREIAMGECLRQWKKLLEPALVVSEPTPEPWHIKPSAQQKKQKAR